MKSYSPGDPPPSFPPATEASEASVRHAPARLTRRQKLNRALLALASVLLAAAIIVWLIPAALDTSWAAIGAELSRVSLSWLAFLFAVALGALLIDSAGFYACFRAVRMRVAFETNAIAQAVTLAIPMGATLSLGLIFARLRRAGLQGKQIVSGIALASVADVLAQFLVPAVAAIMLALSSAALGIGARVTLLVLAVITLALLCILLGLIASEPLLRSLLSRVQDIYDAFNEGFGRASTHLAIPVLETRSHALNQARSALFPILGMPTLSRVFQGLAFIVWCTWAFDFNISPLALFAVCALGRLLALIPLTPGGIGVIDVGVAWALTALGAEPSQAVTAALIFTLTQILLPAIVGALAIPWGTQSARAKKVHSSQG